MKIDNRVTFVSGCWQNKASKNNHKEDPTPRYTYPIGPIQLAAGKLFKKQFANFPEEDQNAIDAFLMHVEIYGFDGKLPGRNKPSWDVPANDPQFITKVDFARQHNLHHYHVGIPFYDDVNETGLGQVSGYVLHYQLFENEFGPVLKVVDYGMHPPFELPKEPYLE